jgi:hypothetical protein
LNAQRGRVTVRTSVALGEDPEEDDGRGNDPQNEKTAEGNDEDQPV